MNPILESQIKSKMEAVAVGEEIAQKAVDILGEKIARVILYGSYARGDFTPESDMNMMVLLDCDATEVETYRKDINRLASRESLDKDVTISIILRDENSFENRKKDVGFYKNVDEEGVVVYDRG